MPNDRMVYSYIALDKHDDISGLYSYILNLPPLFLGYIAENSSFYASLKAGPALQDQEQDQEFMLSAGFFNCNSITEWRFVLFLVNDYFLFYY
jgi:hypothetical protein